MEIQRASGEQFSMLLEFMENHGDLARTRAGPLARFKADRLWVTLTKSLNSIEHGVRKTTERWKRNINSSVDMEFTPLTPKIEISVESVSSPVPSENSVIRSPELMPQKSADPLAPSTTPPNTTLHRRHSSLRGLRRRMFNVDQRYLLVDERHERYEAKRLELEKIRERTEARRVELEEMRERTEARRLDLEEMREKTEVRKVEIEEKRQMTEIRRLEMC